MEEPSGKEIYDVVWHLLDCGDISQETATKVHRRLEDRNKYTESTLLKHIEEKKNLNDFFSAFVWSYYGNLSDLMHKHDCSHWEDYGWLRPDQSNDVLKRQLKVIT